MFTDLSNLIENTIHKYENFQRGLQLGQSDDPHKAAEFTKDEKFV
jgi:hypothetical protein